MPDSLRSEMSDAEREVLKVLWDHGPLPVRDAVAHLEQQGQQWTRSTVITLLQRLESKGYVASDKSQFAFVFRAVVSKEEVLRDRMNELAGELCDGDPLPLMLAFTDQRQFTPEEIARLRQLIDNLAPGKSPRSKRGSK